MKGTIVVRNGRPVPTDLTREREIIGGFNEGSEKEQV
jgi:hypothetical protein